MKRSLGWFTLMCMGIGAIIGAGIFVITGELLPSCAVVDAPCQPRDGSRLGACDTVLHFA